MNDLGKFLTSQEIIIVYIIAALASLVCIIVYLIEKNNENIRKKHNTKELNKLVEEVKSTLPKEESSEMHVEPVLEPIAEENVSSTEPMIIESIDVEETVDLSGVVAEVKQIDNLEDGLEYTSIEPDQKTAKIELQRLQEQLEQDEKLEPVDVVSAYEEEQEKTAIISLDELLQKSKEMYESNEITQYKDEGNEPISIQDLELQVQRQAAVYHEPFVLTDVVDEEDIKADINLAFEQLEEDEPSMSIPNIGIQDSIVTEEISSMEEKNVLHMDDFYTIRSETVNPIVKEPIHKKFQCSPIISPIFGIEHDAAKDNAIALENTANYDKLDQELRANDNFYMTLSELQGKTE